MVNRDESQNSENGSPADENESSVGETMSSEAETSVIQRESPVTFSLEGLRVGFLTCIPVALGVAGYGIAFGVIANQAGLSVAEATLMSATVVAGASQLIAVELWADPIPIAAILFATVAVNLRYSLMGAALEPWFRHLSPTKVYGSLFVMADENWALTIRDLQAGTGRGAFLLGSGIAIWSFWVLSTVVGALAGDAVGDPARFGFDFILAAVFLALAVDLWDGRSTLVPWLVALATALVASAYVPGRWYILLGGLTAALLEVIRFDS